MCAPSWSQLPARGKLMSFSRNDTARSMSETISCQSRNELPVRQGRSNNAVYSQAVYCTGNAPVCTAKPGDNDMYACNALMALYSALPDHSQAMRRAGKYFDSYYPPKPIGVVVELEGRGDVEVGSLQPNQPGVRQVVVVVDTEVVDTLAADDEVLSRQFHHPGVLQVSVRVYDLEVDVAVEVDGLVLVVVIVPSNLQLKQSAHSMSSGSHFGTSSYGLITSLMTPSIPWWAILCHQPLSETVSYTHRLPV